MSDSVIKYFHLSSDDKFFDSVINNCENVAPNENVYVIRDCKSKSLKYVKNEKVKVRPNLQDIIDELSKYNNVEKIFIHFLTKTAIPFVLNIPKNIPVYWIFWGADGYALPGLEHYLFQEETKSFLKDTGVLKRKLSFKLLKQKFFNALGYRKKVKLIDAVNRIDFCATWVQGDYELVRNFNSRMQYFFFNNNSIHQLIQDQGDITDSVFESTKEPISNNYIILGNSGDPTNNHIEAFKIVRNLKDFDIVVPLAYGNKKYIEAITKEGIKILGNRFKPIYDFMPKAKYNSLIENASIVVMNHSRQQAANNILTALWYGIPVYMNEKSTLFDTFKKWGLGVMNINSLEEYDKYKVSTEENRALLSKYLGTDTIRESFFQLLKGNIN